MNTLVNVLFMTNIPRCGVRNWRSPWKPIAKVEEQKYDHKYLFFNKKNRQSWFLFWKFIAKPFNQNRFVIFLFWSI